MPDWLLPTFVLAPAMLWFFFGVGLPYALIVLPRADWHNRLLVIALSLALSPLLSTTVMFLIGTFGQLSALNVLLGTAALCALGVPFALRRARLSAPERPKLAPLSLIEKALIVAIAVAVLLRFWNTAYWCFTTYDALWVYGYNARLFFLEGNIPARIGYYPQHVPLAYTYGQLLWNAIDDHAARTVLPYFALNSILLTYIGAARLFSRRVGLIAAALWTLYPHHAVWSQFGDLEVTLTGYFAGTAAFFILAWRARNARYAVISGLLLAAALWTKPTAGALIQSLLLIGAAALVGQILAQRRLIWRDLWQNLTARLVLLTLIVAFPLGGMWYIRNVLYGHPMLVFPESYWQDAAQRSGQELGWLLLIALLAVPFAARRWRYAALGCLLLWSAALPSAFGGRVPTLAELQQMAVGQIATSVMPTRLGIFEYALLALGAALLAWSVLPKWRALSPAQRGTLAMIAAFVFPYGITWFWSYSYHFRLSFPIVPFFCWLLAAQADSLMRCVQWRYVTRAVQAAAALIVILSFAALGWLSVLSALPYAIAGTLPDDDAKIALGNPALMDLVGFLRQRRAELGRPLKVVAPGELRLNFFFPQDDIRGDWFPMWLDEIADVDYYIDSSVSHRLYNIRGKFYNQIIHSRTRIEVMWRAFTTDDGVFRFSAYEVNNVKRFQKPEPNGKLGVQVGDFAYLHGWDLNNLVFGVGQPIHIVLWWEALKSADLEYSVFIHLWDEMNQRAVMIFGGQPVAGAWQVWFGVPGEHFSQPYPTRLWQAGEIIMDEWRVPVPEDVPAGEYELRVGLYDPISGTRLPIQRGGEILGDFVRLNRLRIVR
ncbi:MAG: glycosyltransferase family 39 protein [Anaerolineae bacterium]|nr:glycosyltransferase family 39 protein [Anaerolineae bacterium]